MANTTVNRMLSKKYRLPISKSDFRGTKIYTNNLKIVFDSSTFSNSRVAIIVSKKYSNKAVKRNRIKRQIRHIAKPHLSTPPFHDILIIVNTSHEPTTDDLTTELNSIFTKLTKH